MAHGWAGDQAYIPLFNACSEVVPEPSKLKSFPIYMPTDTLMRYQASQLDGEIVKQFVSGLSCSFSCVSVS